MGEIRVGDFKKKYEYCRVEPVPSVSFGKVLDNALKKEQQSEKDKFKPKDKER